MNEKPENLSDSKVLNEYLSEEPDEELDEDIEEDFEDETSESTKETEKGAVRSGKRTALKITGSVLGVLLLIFIVYEGFQIYQMKQTAKTLKADLLSVMQHISEKDMDGASEALTKMNTDNRKLRTTLSSPFWSATTWLPFVGKQISSASKLTVLLTTASDEILDPMIVLMTKYPVDSLISKESTSTDDNLAKGGINAEAINAYVEFADSATLSMADITSQMQDLDVSLIDSSGKISAYVKQFTDLTDFLKLASDRVIKPLAEQLTDCPIDTIKVDGKYNTNTIRSYLQFLDYLLPELDNLADDLNERDFSSIDSKGQIKEYVTEIHSLVESLNEACTTVVSPLIEQLQKYPLESIKAGQGFNVSAINSYLTYIESSIGNFRTLSDKMAELENGRLNKTGKITEYKAKIDKIISLYDEGEPYLKLFHTFLGSGEDRFYFLGTQNSAEIRASGGFPGNVGTISIKNGVLTIGDFDSCYNVFSRHVPSAANVTSEERALFVSMPYPWDADFCPDFERVATIWALAYENKNDVHVDGVISITPSVIQDLLAFLGEINLSDGTVLDGTNATAFLQSTIYKRYINRKSSEYKGDDYVGQLFSETAKGTMKLLVSGFKMSYMSNYLGVLEEGLDSRRIMFWFADSEEEAIAEECGASGGLYHDEHNPVAGIYFNLTNASKLGWYTDVEPEVTSCFLNEDGSYTYNISVTLRNTMTTEERDSVSWYIKGDGYIVATVYFFAPAGGTISNFETEPHASISLQTYEDLELGMLRYYTLRPESEITISYQITTAPMAENEMRIVTTPTLTKYREALEAENEEDTEAEE